MLNHTARCLYIHIPKTGGNSVNRLFGVEWEDHKDLRRYSEEMPREQFESYYRFAIVRNPWERLLSDYNYQRKKSRPAASKLGLDAPYAARRSFREWAVAVLSDPHSYAPESWGGSVSRGIHRWSPQADWISLDGRLAVDRVVRMEHLPQGFRQVCADLGLPKTTLPRRNRRLHWHYSWYFDAFTRDLVADYYRKDIELFQYEFQSQPAWAYTLMQRCAATALLWYRA